MSMNVHISDPESSIKARVVDGIEDNALVVATRPLKSYENTVTFFSNQDYGINMNQDASAGGTPDKIHDGTDSILWTASDIVGGPKTTFDSTDQNHTAAGTKSIKVDSAPVGDIFQIAKGSDVTMNNYAALTLWVYVDKDWASGDIIEVFAWDSAVGTTVGNVVSLRDYFSWFSFGVWHKATIPLTDFGNASVSAVVDAFRFRISAVDGKSPKFYLDDIQLEQTGIPISFTVKPEEGTWLYVTDFTIVAADAIASTLTDGTMPNLAYDKFLGETLVSGINYQRTHDGVVVFSLVMNNLLNLLGLPNAFIESGSDGTNTWLMIKIKHPEPILLKPENEDFLSLTISEDLTGLLQLRVSAGGRKEIRK